MSRKKSKPPAAKPAAIKAAPTPAAKPAPRPPAVIEAAHTPRITVSGRWIALAVSAVVLAAGFCAWLVLCLLFWQGGWQLLYHPSATVTRTPAAAGLPFTPIGFASAANGQPQLTGWWIPADPAAQFSRYTVLDLHSQDGNLGDTVDHLAQLHAAGVNVFAFDYRGYGQSHFDHPSESRWLADATSALDYLANTRHIDPGAIVLDGSGLGADLALEVAAPHPDLAGIIVESPLEDPAAVIFSDARASLVPAHLLEHDRWEIAAAAASLRVPSLWFLPFPKPDPNGPAQNPEIFQKVPARKMFVWLPPGKTATKNYSDELSRWLDDLQVK
jgi:pimeloyl-ACP methyl ester carboxylesterase